MYIIESCTCTHASKNAKSDSFLPGEIFYLHKDDTVTWNLTESKDNPRKLSLIECKIYKIYSINNKTLIRFISHRENIEFELESKAENKISLIFDDFCILNCERYINFDLETIYNFLPATEEGFFSDVTIESQNNKKFYVHSVILNLLGCDICWLSNPTPFNGLPEDVLNVIVHWLYSEYLPETIKVDTAIKVIDAVKDYDCLSKLAKNCQMYIDKISVKNQFMNAVNDLHICMDQMLKYFKGSETEVRKDASKMCLILKQCLREICVGSVKLIKLFDIFNKNIKCSDVNVKLMNAKQEIMQFAYLCMPKLMCKLRAFLESLKMTLSPMTQSQKSEVVSYLIPEIPTGLNLICDILYDFRMIFENNKELPYFVEYNIKFTHTLVFFLDKKQCYSEMPESYKYRFVLRNLDFLIDELPIILLKLEDLIDCHQIDWNEFKSFFDITTNSMSETLKKISEHRPIFQNILEKICCLVERQSFTMDLLNLNLLEFVHDLTETSEVNEQQEFHPQSENFQACNVESDVFNYNINLCKDLLISPDVNHRELAKASYELLKSSKNTDMIFEIPIQTPNSQSVKTPDLTSSENNSPVEAGDSASLIVCSKSEEYSKCNSYETVDENGSVLIKAHRTIVAARCNWFRRALQSGMKEAINSHIVIHDTTPEMFKEFLYYLYTGNLDTNLNIEKLTELILFGDRYELDGLKLECELLILSKHLNVSNAFFYLNLADQYNAKYLKKSCMEYIVKQCKIGSITHKDIIDNLSPTLQVEINQIITYYSVNNLFTSKNFDRRLMTENFSTLSVNDDNVVVNSGEQEVDYERLNECLTFLRNIFGPQIPVDELSSIIISSNYDINRALDYYFVMSTMNVE